MNAEVGVSVILFDRDGTLIVNVPHNTDPAKVDPMPTAIEALELVRRHGVRMAVVTNQSVIGRGWATREDVDATNTRIEQLLGPIGPFLICPHSPDDGCACRKPKPDLIHRATAQLGAQPQSVVLIGDMGIDMDAAAAAGVRSILVPTAETPGADIARSRYVAPTLLAAVESVLRHGTAQG